MAATFYLLKTREYGKPAYKVGVCKSNRLRKHIRLWKSICGQSTLIATKDFSRRSQAQIANIQFRDSVRHLLLSRSLDWYRRKEEILKKFLSQEGAIRWE